MKRSTTPCERIQHAYPGALEETILTEIVANALDSGASAIAIASDPVGATFTVIDNGRGILDTYGIVVSRADGSLLHALAPIFLGA